MQNIFESWALGRKTNEENPLNQSTIDNYQFIWGAWLNYLKSFQFEFDWRAARPTDVKNFLQSIRPTSSTKESASSVTHKRYARVLREIYALAVVNGAISNNPVTSYAFLSFTEAQESFVFSTESWNKIEAITPFPDNTLQLTPWESVRNNAILHLLIFDALQVTEIQEVQGQDCLFNSNVCINRLAVRGLRPAQNRVLTLHCTSAKSLTQWFHIRKLKMDPKDSALAPLFFSRKGGSKLSSKSVFCIAKDYLDISLPANIETYRRSPGAIRNTRISEWLKNESSAIVARKAGLQDVNSLTRLLPKY